MKRQSILQANFQSVSRRGFSNVVADDNDAARQALAGHATTFNTVAYECDVIETDKGPKYKFVDGQVFKGNSPTRFVGVDKILTVDDIVAEIEQAVDAGQTGLAGKLEGYKLLAKALKEQNLPSASYIVPSWDRNSETKTFNYLALKNGEKAFDGAGRQIWPQIAQQTGVSQSPTP